MAAPPLARRNLFERSDRYKDLHQIALTTKPAGAFEDDVFVVAVLHHEKDPTEAGGSDFIWFKVKRVSQPIHPPTAFLRPVYGSIRSKSFAKPTITERNRKSTLDTVVLLSLTRSKRANYIPPGIIQLCSRVTKSVCLLQVLFRVSPYRIGRLLDL